MSQPTFHDRLDLLDLPDEVRERIEVQFDRLVGSVQDTYGMERREAERFVERQLAGLDIRDALSDRTSG